MFKLFNNENYYIWAVQCLLLQVYYKIVLLNGGLSLFKTNFWLLRAQFMFKNINVKNNLVQI
jgi:hypothetical protein